MAIGYLPGENDAGSDQRCPSAPWRVLVVDDRLGNERGHQLEFVRGMVACFARRGAQVEVWAHRQFPPQLAIAGAEVRRLFSLSWAEAFARASRWTRTWAVLTQNGRLLWHLLRPGQRRRWDLVVASEATIFHLLGWRVWLTWVSRSTRLVLVFVHPPWLLEYTATGAGVRPKPQAVLYRRAVRWFGRRVAAGQCRLGADVPTVARELRKSGVAVAEVTVPIADAVMEKFGRPPLSDRPLRIGVLGRPCEERGFDRVLSAIDGWLGRPEGAGLCFVVQWHEGDDSDSSGLRRLEALAERFPEGVQVLRGSLNENEYTGMLNSLHGGLLAYNRAAYRHRASHVAAELLCAGRPYVTTRGTWMSEQMALHGSGETCGEDPASIVEALERFVESYDRHASLAWQRRAAACRYFSWARFWGPDGIDLSEVMAGR